MKYPSDMDPECMPLCDALNALPGIRTTESCCGHNERPFLVIFSAEQVESLRPILKAAYGSGWHIDANWANGSDTIYFCLRGPIGDGGNDFVRWLS
jgi:hypothetical protein